MKERLAEIIEKTLRSHKAVISMKRTIGEKYNEPFEEKLAQALIDAGVGFVDRDQIMNKLYERDFIDAMHRKIKEGLVGSLRNEYLLQKPAREPYEKWNEYSKVFISMPIFSAMVDMMTANLLHYVAKELVDEVLSCLTTPTGKE